MAVMGLANWACPCNYFASVTQADAQAEAPAVHASLLQPAFSSLCKVAFMYQAAADCGRSMSQLTASHLSDRLLAECRDAEQ